MDDLAAAHPEGQFLFIVEGVLMYFGQPQELVFHALLRGHNGVYADVAIASSQQKAEEYCRQWLDNPVVRQYL
ncbi:hypothetical protein [Bacterioplanoides pacificum]|uniref:Leucine carboxyl methyltransferase n=1 Tax=Bacterioplanoides pacificum TaxID=1171596 RepID=A0ABV7VWZ3_9GAMM